MLSGIIYRVVAGNGATDTWWRPELQGGAAGDVRW